MEPTQEQIGMQSLPQWRKEHKYILSNYLYLMDYLNARYMESDIVRFSDDNLETIANGWGYSTYALRRAVADLKQALINSLPFRRK